MPMRSGGSRIELREAMIHLFYAGEAHGGGS